MIYIIWIKKNKEKKRRKKQLFKHFFLAFENTFFYKWWPIYWPHPTKLQFIPHQGLNINKYTESMCEVSRSTYLAETIFLFYMLTLTLPTQDYTSKQVHHN